MFTPIIAAGLMLALGAGEAAGTTDQSSPAARIARAESELCLTRCPPSPASPTSDWLRSPEGRKVNACVMSCRMDPPAAALFKSASALALSKEFDPAAPAVKAHGKDAPALLQRLRWAAQASARKRPGRLCARARARSPSSELAYVKCTGRVVPAGAGPLPPPDPSQALRCAVAFAESERRWLTRCAALEKKVDLESCAESSEAPDSDAACEAEAVSKLALALRQRTRP